MNRFEMMKEENDVFQILPDGKGFVGIVYHPDTGNEIQKFYSGSEEGVRIQLIKYIYSTVPMNYRTK